MIYIDIKQAINIHKLTIEVSGGGANGIINAGYLESALHHIQNDDYYPTFEDKLTHLFFAANKFHSFEDGNKRIAISLGMLFLLLNGYLYCVQMFNQEMENISYHLADGKISKELLHEIIFAIINEVEISAELKLKIYNAIKI